MACGCLRGLRIFQPNCLFGLVLSCEIIMNSWWLASIESMLLSPVCCSMALGCLSACLPVCVTAMDLGGPWLPAQTTKAQRTPSACTRLNQVFHYGAFIVSQVNPEMYRSPAARILSQAKPILESVSQTCVASRMGLHGGYLSLALTPPTGHLFQSYSSSSAFISSFSAYVVAISAFRSSF